MKQRIARRNSVANRENAPAQPREIQKIEITHHQVFEVERALSTRGEVDPRIRALYNMVDAYGDVVKKLQWHASNMSDEVMKVDRLGMDAVYETLMSTSLIEDIKRQVAVYRALRSTLEWSCRAEDDPLANEVDRLIHTLDRNRG